MTLAVRKLRVDDGAKLQALVVENFDAIEQGLTVLDSRLLLGHATIDVLGVDSNGALVLGAIGFTANEEMLLKAVEAYSWCLEYPESLVRLYPSCEVSEDRPPRLLFVVERVPDAFHRKIKQLGFPEVDCVEVRHLEFDGVPAVYFETLLRLRRGVGPARAVDTAAAGSAADTVTDTRPVARAATPKLPEVSTTEAPASPRAAEPAAVPAVAGPDRLVVEASLPTVALRDLPELSAEPVVPSVPAAAPGAATEEPGVSFKDLSATLLGGSSAGAAEQPKTRTQIALPQEFAGLNFPNDGVLTRQWMDFLNQMSNRK